MSNKLRCYVQINSIAKPILQINSAKHKGTEFINFAMLRLPKDYQNKPVQTKEQ